MAQQEGTGPEAGNGSFRGQRGRVPFWDPGNSPHPGSLSTGGQAGTFISGGERVVSSPLPQHSYLRILDVGEAAVPSSPAAAACLSPWQPGQKTNSPVSRLWSLPWSGV